MSFNFVEALAGAPFYPITDRKLSRLSHAEQVLQLAEGGATLVQLRDKTSSPLEFYAQAEVALQAARQCGLKVIINDRVDLALALKATGVHLGQDDLPPEAARRILGDAAVIGYSTHNLSQAKIAIQFPIDYLAIGPIFSTATKKSSNPPVGLENLRLIRGVIGTIPLVAIGGITFKNRLSVLNAGADAVAVIADIWNPPGPVATRVRRYLESG